MAALASKQESVKIFDKLKSKSENKVSFSFDRAYTWLLLRRLD